ncbi:MerR family transcriptional regulator [Paenibacillus sp. JCM 10914]|uniref:MerR family transcriptional regulator n=1 Tax=Paenibacillus sp. JCM 10914 TaxID=1236974 RepID=UPI00068BF28A|nr:MerR family transcriptional regulator [Paenibacillus sp. JCM 10914]
MPKGEGGVVTIRKHWKVGELATRMGVTVRTLHHYDQIGLFTPSEATESGHRLYTEADVAKLRDIMTLRQLGFSLAEIRTALDRPEDSLRDMLHAQLGRLDQQIGMLHDLRNRIAEIDDLLHAGELVSRERLTMVIQYMKMAESGYFHAEQGKELKELIKELLPRDMEEQKEAGEKLITQFRVSHLKGIAVDDPVVQDLAKAWYHTMLSMRHADQAFIQSAEQYYAQHPDEALAYGMDGDLYRYIRQAVAVITGE